MKFFRRPVILLLCAAVALCGCLCGCSGEKREKNFPVALSVTDRSALELNPDDKEYKDVELAAIYAYAKENPSVTDLNDEYPICCLRKDDGGYHVVYEGQKRVLVLWYDEEGNWIESEKLTSIARMVTSRGKLDAVKIGDSIKKVQSADPYRYYPFLTDASAPLYSDHYCEDGYHVHLTFERVIGEDGEENIVVTSNDYDIM